MAEKQEDDKKSANQAPLESNMSSLASLSISLVVLSISMHNINQVSLYPHLYFQKSELRSIINSSTYSTSIYNMSTLNLRSVSSSASPTSKPIPSPSLLKPWDFSYASSPDGKDRNLLIMFHGLGRYEFP